MYRLAVSRLLLLLAVLSAGPLAGRAQPAAGAPAFAFRAEVLEEGVFKPVGPQTSRRERGAATGTAHEHDALQLVESTRSLRAAQGITFGFRYRLSGLPGKEPAGFSMRALHPPMKGADGKRRTVSTAPLALEAEQGVAENDIVYTLGEPAEVLPGRWQLQLLHRGRVVLAREFELK
jgi:hypothetical protein